MATAVSRGSQAAAGGISGEEDVRPVPPGEPRANGSPHIHGSYLACADTTASTSGCPTQHGGLGLVLTGPTPAPPTNQICPSAPPGITIS